MNSSIELNIKYFIGIVILLILFGSVLMHCNGGENDKLRQPTKGKQLYQKNWGPGPVIVWPFGDVDPVAWPAPETKEDADKRAYIEKLEADTEAYKQDLSDEREMKNDGHFWMKVGAGLFVVGVFMFVALQKYGIEGFGFGSAILGVLSVCYGALCVKMAGMETVIAWGFVLAAVISIAAWFCKGQNLLSKVKEMRDKRKCKIKPKS